MGSVLEEPLSITNLHNQKKTLNNDQQQIKDVCYEFLNIVYQLQKESIDSDRSDDNYRQSWLKFERSASDSLEQLSKQNNPDEGALLDIERALCQSIANFFMGAPSFCEHYSDDKVYQFIDKYLIKAEDTNFIVMNKRVYQHSKEEPQSVEDFFMQAVQNGDLKKVTDMIGKQYLDQGICQKAFMFSLKNGHPKVVEAIYKLADNIQLNYCDSDGNSCLMLALQNGMYDFINQVIKENIDTIDLAHHNKKFIHLFILALQKQCLDKLDLKPFIDRELHIKSFDGVYPLFYAIEATYVVGVETLLKLKVDINRECKLLSDASNFLFLAQMMVNDGRKFYYSDGIYRSTHDMRDAILLDLIQRRSINQNGTPLCAAVNSGSNEIVKLLIAGGADVSKRMQGGTTPLHIAVLNKDIEAFEQLIASGADVNAADDYGNTPLIFAAMNGLEGVTEILISKGANVEHKTRSGETALMTAAYFNRMEIVKKLYNKNTFRTIRNRGGFTALDMAKRYSNNLSMVMYMLDRAE